MLAHIPCSTLCTLGTQLGLHRHVAFVCLGPHLVVLRHEPEESCVLVQLATGKGGGAGVVLDRLRVILATELSMYVPALGPQCYVTRHIVQLTVYVMLLRAPGLPLPHVIYNREGHVLHAFTTPSLIHIKQYPGTCTWPTASSCRCHIREARATSIWMGSLLPRRPRCRACRVQS